MTTSDHTGPLQEAVREARAQRRPLLIQGSGSKAFYGRSLNGKPLDVTAHAGVVAYDPSDLVITARAGTPLAELDQTLAQYGQMLGFEPPHFGGGGTLGGAVATGIAGPRRPHQGSVRDYVLGVECLNGRGERVRYGGRVIKNVAGFDLARLMVGAQGTLGVLLEVSLRVLPRAQFERTLRHDVPRQRAQRLVGEWQRKPFPLTGLCYDGRSLYARLSGTRAGVESATAALGGESLEGEESAGYWQRLRDHEHPFLAQDGALWRIAVPAGADTPADLPGDWLYEWGFMQRWLRTRASPEGIRNAAQRMGGHATLFRGNARGAEPFQALPEPLAQLTRRVKAALDPDGILNPGRLYPEF